MGLSRIQRLAKLFNNRYDILFVLLLGYSHTVKLASKMSVVDCKQNLADTI